MVDDIHILVIEPAGDNPVSSSLDEIVAPENWKVSSEHDLQSASQFLDRNPCQIVVLSAAYLNKVTLPVVKSFLQRDRSIACVALHNLEGKVCELDLLRTGVNEVADEDWFISSGSAVRVIHRAIARNSTRDECSKRLHLFQQMLDAVPDLIFLKDRSNQVVWANQAFQQFFDGFETKPDGLLAIDKIEESFQKYYLEGDRQIFENNVPMHIQEEPVKRPDGKVIPFETKKSPIRGEDGKPEMLIGIARSLEERKLMEDELRRHNRLQAIGHLAAGISHEINTPVQFIADNLSYLLAELVPSKSDSKADTDTQNDRDIKKCRKIEAALRESVEGIEQVSQIVKAIKLFSYSENDTEKSLVCTQKVIQAAVDITSSIWRSVAVVEQEFSTPLPLVYANDNLLNQAFLNILVNAIEAIKVKRAHTGQLGHLTIKAYPLSDHLIRATIHDDGIGISPELQERIFDPFFTTKDVGDGAGYGLSVAHKILVNEHGGKINIESTPGKGTTFEITLPTDRNQLTEEERPYVESGTYSISG